MAGLVNTGFFENQLSEGTHHLMKMNLFPPVASDSGPRCWGQPAMFFREGSVEKWMRQFT